MPNLATNNVFKSNLFQVSDPTLKRVVSADAALAKAQQGIDQKKIAKVEGSAKQFESMFISEMLKPMFDTVQTDEVFGGGQGEDTWKGMMVDQYAQKITDAGGFGLSDTIKAKMIEMQSMADHAANSEGSVSDPTKTNIDPAQTAAIPEPQSANAADAQEAANRMMQQITSQGMQ